MTKTLLSSAVALFLLAPAHTQFVGKKTGIDSVLGIGPTTQEVVTEAANRDMMEITAAKLAQEKGGAEEKSFAQQMTIDHIKTTNHIKAMVESGEVKAEIPATQGGKGGSLGIISVVHCRAAECRARQCAATYRPRLRAVALQLAFDGRCQLRFGV
jgi:uncharacterized protein DUF4142